jgi:hypothetical protein
MRTNLEKQPGQPQTAKDQMKNKIIIATVFTLTSAVLLTGCIVVNVEKTAPTKCCSSSPGIELKSSATNSSGNATNSLAQ